MKQIRVKALFGNHSIYQEIIRFPPKGIIYSGIKREVLEGKYYEKKMFNKKISNAFQKVNLPRMIPIMIKGEDLIHTSRGILPLQIIKKRPWVIDIEHAESFAGMHYKVWNNIILKNIVKKFLLSKYCKKIMPHCIAAEKSLLNSLDCSKFKDKIDVVYPATHIPKIKKKKHNKIKLLFVSSLFFVKGGIHLLEVFKELEKKYRNIELIIKSDIPENLKRKYYSKNIKFFPYKAEILPRKQLLKQFYSKADIFIYPTFIDTFGYGLLDAMTCCLPIVASDIFAIPEIVENGKNGFLVHAPVSWTNKKGLFDTKKWLKLREEIHKGKLFPEFISEIVKKTSLLIENSRLRKKMGKKGYNMVKDGKFSIKERNKNLRRIYEEALKR